MAMVSQSVFGGLVASMDPTKLPEGASPMNWDVDYVTGGVRQRPGKQNVYSFNGASAGPNPAFSAVDTVLGKVPWTNPGNILLDDGNFAIADIVGSSSAASTTASGSSVGGGVAWSNPANIDSNVAFASVSLSAGGTNYYPSTGSGSVSNAANPSNQSPPTQYAILSGFASVAASSATLYVSVSASVSASMGGGTLGLDVSQDSGATWTNEAGGSGSFSSVVPISLSSLTNLDTIQIRLSASCSCGPTGYANVSISVSGWYATVAGGSGLTAQTLQAAVSGLSVPAGATIAGVEVSFNADYSGTAPSFSIGLNVGSVDPGFTLTASPAIYTGGGPTSLWGYSSWTAATLSSLVVSFFASSTGATTVNVNQIKITGYYTLPTLVSDYLDVTNFTFAVGATQGVTGVAVALKGYSTNAQTVNVWLLSGGAVIGTAKAYIPAGSVSTVILGGINDSWNAALTSAIVNSPTFGVRIQGSGAGLLYFDYVTMTLALTPASSNINYIGPILSPTGVKYNLALDAAGNWYLGNGTTLTQILTGTVAGAFGQAITVYDRAFVSQFTLTGQVQGIDIPRQYNYEGQWWDRITQVGPGAAPVVSAAQAAGAIATITSVSLSGTIATITAANSYSAGDVGTFAGLTGGACTGLNGQTLIVLSTGLSSTAFEVAYTGAAGGPYAQTGATFTPQYVYPVSSITQPAAASDPSDPGHFQGLLWSAGPGSTSAGNNVTVYYSDSFVHSQPDTTLVNAFNAGYPVYVYIAGAPFGNGIWQVTSIGNAIPPGGAYYRWYFTFQVPTSNYQYYGGPDSAAGTYQITQGTVTLSSPVPGLAPGAQVSIAGASVAAWDGTYPIVEAVNSGAFSISQSALSGGTATFTWALTSGVAPSAGQLVTITNTLNANGILNVVEALIATATGVSSGTFTIDGFASSLTYPTTVEEGQATTAGTKFIIDPGTANVGSTTVNPIYGNATGGTLTIVGSASSGTLPIGAGTRQVVQYFVTRNGLYTMPSPPATVSIPLGSNYLQVNLLIGPPNVIARGIAVTQAGQNGVAGANFYTSTVPTTFIVGGVTYVSSSFLVNDNTTTTAKFTFSDAVLLQSEAIDIPGNNWFNLIELGNPAWMFQYQDQTFYGACQNKVQNFVNMSFDGGYWQPSGGAPALPAGWNVDANYAFPFGTPFTVTAFSIASNIVTVECVNTLTAGLTVIVNGLSTGTYLNGQPLTILTVSGTQFTAAFTHADVTLTSDSGTVASSCSTIALRESPVFGNSLYLVNQTGSTQATLGMITQSAYQDAYNVAILNPAASPVPYSVRVTCRAPSGATTGSLVIDLVASNQGVYGATYGSYTLALSAMTNQLATYTGTLTAGIPTIPAGLLVRAYLSGVPHLADVEIDRIEPFPTNQPVLTNTVYVSYPGEPEQVDGADGQLTLSSQSPDPAYGATIIHNQIVFKKAHSIVECESAPNLQPAQWTTREVSLVGSGAVGPNAFAQGDEWDIGLSKDGIYVYAGGMPMPISRELQGYPGRAQFWDQFNWNAAQTFWMAHDLRLRRLYAGMAMNTPNPWLPNAPAATPTSPNVVLMLNYDGVPTPQELEGGAPVHVTMFGNLKAMDMRRKWSLWQIISPFAGAAYDGLYGYDTVLLGSGIGTNKIYRLVDCSLQPTDDGVPIAPLYLSSPFPDAEKAQALGIGLGQKYAYKWMANMAGSAAASGVRIRHLQNVIGDPHPVTVPFVPALVAEQANNIEWRAEVRGQRIFTEFSMNQTGTAEAGWFELMEYGSDFISHPWGTWRNVSS